MTDDDVRAEVFSAMGEAYDRIEAMVGGDEVARRELQRHITDAIGDC